MDVGRGDRPAAVGQGGGDRGPCPDADFHERVVPEGVRFVRDDVTDPDPAVYRGADAVYALNCPPELQRPLSAVARAAAADCLFTTLGTDPVVVDAVPETLPDGTLFETKA